MSHTMLTVFHKINILTDLVSNLAVYGIGENLLGKFMLRYFYYARNKILQKV